MRKELQTIINEVQKAVVGKQEIVEKILMAILAEGDAQDRADLIYLEKLPLFHPDGTVME